MNFKFIMLIFIFVLPMVMCACAAGSGCPAERADTVKSDRRGKLKGTGGKTKLFPGKR